MNRRRRFKAKRRRAHEKAFPAIHRATFPLWKARVPASTARLTLEDLRSFMRHFRIQTDVTHSETRPASPSAPHAHSD